MRNNIIFSLVLGPALVACGGAATTPQSPGLMSETHAGQNRCLLEGDAPKLFVIDWDATDVSSFQARAARDVVFVRFEGCNMRVIEGCSDSGLAGRYGTYGTPQYTSGSLARESIRTQDELGTKLPLGVATVGAEVSSGKALELQYYVAGTATATRDSVFREELSANPACSEATHVVWAYSLGAYSLESTDASRVAGSTAVAGVGAEASHARDAKQLRHAGKIEECTKVDNFGCRVPIRLTLRAIRDGAAPAPEPAATVVPASVSTEGVQATMQAMQLRGGAEQKYMAHDGAGCLAELDRADRSDPAGKMARLELRARCEMRAGRCDEGKGHYREARKAWYRDHNPTGLASDETIEHEVSQLAAQECASAAGGGKSGMNRALELTQQIMQASMRNDTNACIQHGNELHRISSDPSLGKMGAAALQHAAQCAAKGGRCTEARRFYLTFAKLFMDADEAFAQSAFEENIPSCKGQR